MLTANIIIYYNIMYVNYIMIWCIRGADPAGGVPGGAGGGAAGVEEEALDDGPGRVAVQGARAML